MPPLRLSAIRPHCTAGLLLGLGLLWGPAPSPAQQALSPAQLAIQKAESERKARLAAEARAEDERRQREASEKRLRELEDQLRQQERRARAPALPAAIAAQAPAPAVADIAKEETFTVNGVGFKMVAIPAGSFVMGHPPNEPGPSYDGLQRQVSVKAYQLGQTEVTKGLWKALMGTTPSFFHQCADSCPVESVSWDMAQEFIEKLNAQTGQRFRLPSEAEWEYAARAGCKTAFNVGGQCRSKIELSEANFGKKYGLMTTPAGSFAANSWGLYDMHGNVGEWVQDCYARYDPARLDGMAVNASSCSGRVIRGGSFYAEEAVTLRSDWRDAAAPAAEKSMVGFRLARTAF